MQEMSGISWVYIGFSKDGNIYHSLIFQICTEKIKIKIRGDERNNERLLDVRKWNSHYEKTCFIPIPKQQMIEDNVRFK